MIEQSTRRPLITANMVTVMRLLPMPLLCWLVYRNQIWLALVLGSLIACTDFVDGFLARRHGPTVLGGLLDPIADKVFIAFAYLPFADMGVIPAWAVALMFVREFVVTALRSAYEQRGLSMKTSYFGKVKTWTQMQGLGMILLFVLLQNHKSIMLGLLLALVVAPIVAMVVLRLITGKFWLGAVLMSLLTLPLLYFQYLNKLDLTIYFAMVVVVAATWLSGIDYLLVAVRQLRGRGDFGRADAVRLIGGALLPVAVFVALVLSPMPAWALVTILAVELAAGGLDNLLSHHKAASGALLWGVRTIGAPVLLFAGLIPGLNALVITVLAAVAAALSTFGVCYEFWRGRDYYIDQRLRAKAMQASMAT